MIRVVKGGMLTTVQDLGRFRSAHLGLSPAGAADALSFRAANLLVGNHENAPALESTLLGPVLEFQQDALIAVAGAASSANLPCDSSFKVAAGERLDIGALISGARAYIAVRGGFDVPRIMESAATFLAAGIGGFHGRALKAGDELGIGRYEVSAPRRLRPRANWHDSGPIRIIAASQVGWFDADAMDALTGTEYRVSDHSNRSGIRLMGTAIRAVQNRELITEGVALGAIQVPADGEPIILFVDQQTTGGYPKIATVIAADLPRLGQLRPRDAVHFQNVTMQEAVDLLRRQEARFREAFES